MEGRELLHMLASSPATAQFLTRKLAVRFVSDDPPQSPRRPHGQVLSLQRRRHPRRPQNPLPLARVLVQPTTIAPRSRRLLSSSSPPRAPATPTSTTCSPSPTTSARWACRSTAHSAHRLQLEILHVGQHRRARRPHELRTCRSPPTGSPASPSTGPRIPDLASLRIPDVNASSRVRRTRLGAASRIAGGVSVSTRAGARLQQLIRRRSGTASASQGNAAVRPIAAAQAQQPAPNANRS